MPVAGSPMPETRSPARLDGPHREPWGQRFRRHLAELRHKNAGRPVNPSRKLGRAGDPQPMRPVDFDEVRLRRAELQEASRCRCRRSGAPQTIARAPAKAIVPYLNERMLYQFQWGYRKDGRSLAEYKAWARTELRPILYRMLEIAIREDILLPQAAYGYWRCAAEGNDVILFDDDGRREVARFGFRARTRRAASASPISCATSMILSATSRPPGRDDGRARLGGGARVVRRRPLPGLPLPARHLGRDGRGVRRIRHKRIRGELGFAAKRRATMTRC